MGSSFFYIIPNKLKTRRCRRCTEFQIQVQTLLLFNSGLINTRVSPHQRSVSRGLVLRIRSIPGIPPEKKTGSWHKKKNGSCHKKKTDHGMRKKTLIRLFFGKLDYKQIFGSVQNFRLDPDLSVSYEINRIRLFFQGGGDSLQYNLFEHWIRIRVTSKSFGSILSHNGQIKKKP